MLKNKELQVKLATVKITQKFLIYLPIVVRKINDLMLSIFCDIDKINKLTIWFIFI